MALDREKIIIMQLNKRILNSYSSNKYKQQFICRQKRPEIFSLHLLEG